MRRGRRWRNRWGILLVAAPLLVAACNLSARAMAWNYPTSGPLWREVMPVGSLPESVPESSGLAASGQMTGVYWTHNDSGHDPLLQAIDSTGKPLGSVLLTGAPAADWEAISAGPCPEGRCLYVGDVGDNYGSRGAVQLIRLAEPAVPPAGVVDTVPPAQLRLLAVRYPDRPQDVEAMFVTPDTAVWLLSKRPDWYALWSGPARLYRVPASAWRAIDGPPSGGSLSSSAPQAVTAEAMGTLPVVPGRLSAREWITDASLSSPRADGSRWLAVLTYGTLHVFRTDSASGAPGGRIGRCRLPIAEHDPEAVAWHPDGTLLVSNEGRGSTLYRGRCP